MKKTIRFAAILLSTVVIVGGLTIALLTDCGKEAAQLNESADDKVFYSQDKPYGVILPEDVRKFFVSLTTNFETHNLDAIMEHFSEEFLHQGMTKQAFRDHLVKSLFINHIHSMKVTLLKFATHHDVFSIAGFIEADIGILPQSSEFLPILDGSQMRLEHGKWKLFGNQKKSPIGAFQDFLFPKNAVTKGAFMKFSGNYNLKCRLLNNER